MRKAWRVGLFLAFAGPVGSAAALAQPGASPPAQLWQEAPPAAVPPELARLNEALTRLAESLRPALVQVQVRRSGTKTESEEGRRRSMGSGFLVHPDGYLVTNAHVIDDAADVYVRLASGRRFRGKVVGRDGRVDLALVKIEAPEKLPVLPLGDSDGLRVGEFVMALGHPFGLEHSVSFGIVSRKGAPLARATPGFDFIQTDAAVNPGNSGGPLVNLGGQVVGVNTAAARNGSIGFAIPANLVKALLPELLAKGKMEWGWLGVRIEEITEENATDYGLQEPRGVAIESVMPDQPAARAGVRAKDVVLAVDGSVVATHRDLQRLIASTPAGKIVRLRFIREGQEQELAVTVGRYPESEEQPAKTPEPRQSP